MTPRPNKKSPDRGDARVRLLEAARDIIRAKGFAATSVDDLCKAAEVTKGAFFHHFKSKEDLGVVRSKGRPWRRQRGSPFEKFLAMSFD